MQTTTANPYPFRVDFDKVFVEGNLKGMRIQESVRFATQSAAVFYAKQEGYTITPCAGSGAYRIENARVERNA